MTGGPAARLPASCRPLDPNKALQPVQISVEMGGMPRSVSPADLPATVVHDAAAHGQQRAVRVQLQAELATAAPTGCEPPQTAVEAAGRAVLLARQVQRPDLQMQAAVWQCVHLRHLGRFGELLDVARLLLAELCPADRPPLRSRARQAAIDAGRQELLRLQALSAGDAGRFDIALAAANELVRLTTHGAPPGAALHAAFALGACLERMGDSWQAVRVLQQALDEHGEQSPDNVLMVASNALCAFNIGILHRMSDADDAGEKQHTLARARQAGEGALRVLRRSPDPAYEVAVFGNLGEVMLHQGEVAESEPLLRRAQARAQEMGLRAHGWRASATWCDWLLASGRTREAALSACRLLQEMGDLAPPQTAVRAHHAAYRASRLLRHPAQALRHFEAVERIERKRVTAQLKAQSQLFVTRMEMQREQHLLLREAERARSDARQHRERSECDPLTGIGNRRHLARRIAELFPAGEQDSRPLALAQIDIDHFKRINDTHGHAAGDRVLVTLAALLRENTRTGDVLVRLGGEEFLIILPDLEPAQAADFCERLRGRVASHAWPDIGGVGALTVSIGLVGAPPYDEAALMLAADRALYRAKSEGRNRLCVGPHAS